MLPKHAPYQTGPHPVKVKGQTPITAGSIKQSTDRYGVWPLGDCC